MNLLKKVKLYYGFIFFLTALMLINIFPIIASADVTLSSIKSKVDYTTGGGPRKIATGDFNGDGVMDLAVANYTSGTVSILMGSGNGDGTFHAKVDYNTGANTFSVAVGDFDKDSKLDFVVANDLTSTVTIWKGNGDGTFNSTGIYSTGSSVRDLVAGDFNNDGKIDLVFGNGNDNTISILLGNGDGTFMARVNYATGGFPLTIGVGDFNGDGNLDLATANSTSNSLSILLGKGDGTFSTKVDYPTTGTGMTGVAVGDFNGDKKLDLAVTDIRSNTMSIFTGKGDGTFNAMVDYPSGTGSADIAVGDFNGDNKIDLVVTNSYVNSISIFTGKGDGTFNTKVDYTTGGTPIKAVIGDFNKDGFDDIAVSNLYSSSVSIFMQEPVYNINAIGNQTMAQIKEGYVSETQETKTITLTKAGNADLKNLKVVLSGTNAGSFEITNPLVNTLNSSSPATTFTIKAKDGLAIGSYIGTVTVSADNMIDTAFTISQEVIPAALIMSTTKVPSGLLNALYSGYTFTSTGGTGIKTYAITAGSLPAGLILAADGTLSGTPTVAGTFNFTVTASDSATVKVTATRDVTLTVDEIIVSNPKFTIGNTSLVTTGGILANVTVTPVQLGTSYGVVIFELFNGSTPVSIMAINEDITSAKIIKAQFMGYSGSNYSVKVMIWDSLDNTSTYVGENVAIPVTIKP